jgi:hypothetical protein
LCVLDARVSITDRPMLRGLGLRDLPHRGHAKHRRGTTTGVSASTIGRCRTTRLLVSWTEATRQPQPLQRPSRSSQGVSSTRMRADLPPFPLGNQRTVSMS